MGNIYVQHLRDTTKCKQTISIGHGVPKMGGGTWISQWKKKFGKLPKSCPGCFKKNVRLSGCHVCDVNMSIRYICPMCKNCNDTRYGEWIIIPKSLKLLTLDKCKHGYLENTIPPKKYFKRIVIIIIIIIILFISKI